MCHDDACVSMHDLTAPSVTFCSSDIRMTHSHLFISSFAFYFAWSFSPGRFTLLNKSSDWMQSLIKGHTCETNSEKQKETWCSSGQMAHFESAAVFSTHISVTTLTQGHWQNMSYHHIAHNVSPVSVHRLDLEQLYCTVTRRNHQVLPKLPET